MQFNQKQLHIILFDSLKRSYRILSPVFGMDETPRVGELLVFNLPDEKFVNQIELKVEKISYNLVSETVNVICIDDRCYSREKCQRIDEFIQKLR